MQAEKIKLYNEFIDVFMETLKLTKVQNPKDRVIQVLGIRLQSVGLRMSIISSDEILENFIMWRAIASDGDAIPTMEAFGKLILSMRKELLGETLRTKNDILDILT